MMISRRALLGTVACAAALPRTAPRCDCALLDLRENCSLPESLAGYESALAEARVSFVRTVPGEPNLSPSLLLPAAAALDDDTARQLSAWVRNGGRLLLESGLGFGNPTEFAAQRALLRRYFGLTVEPPLDLWPDREGHVPYVDYGWPLCAKIRDFSRIVPVSAPGAEIIGWVDQIPVALKRELGAGRLIFLGSPLGPALWAGDREARVWLRALFAHSIRGSPNDFHSNRACGEELKLSLR